MRSIVASGLLLFSLLLPAAANASKPSDDASASTPRVRVSTGVTEPTLIQSTDISIPDGFSGQFLPPDATVGLTLTVDEKGQPQDIHVTKGFNPYWDARVVDAVRNFRYRPGSMDEKTIPVDVNLTVSFAH